MNSCLEKKKRNSNIDIARGIAIILVIVGHSISTTDSFTNRMILSFHMPLFFIISGMCCNPDHIQTQKELFHKIINNFIIPQVCLGITWTIEQLIIERKLFEDIPFIYNVARWWFLIVMLYITLIVYFMKKMDFFSKKRVMIWVTAVDIIFSIIAIVFNPDIDGTYVGYINVLPIAFTFYLLGYCSQTVFLKISKMNNTIIIIIGMAVCAWVGGKLNTPVLMYKNGYGNIAYFIITSLAGSVSIILIANRISKCNFLQWCGKNSLYLYVFQFSICVYSRWIANNIMHICIMDNIYLFRVLSIVIAVPFTILLVILKNKVVAWGYQINMDRSESV